MFGLFKRKTSNDSYQPSLNSVTFDSRNYSLRGEPDPGKVRVWQTPESDLLGLYFFDLKPDLPDQAQSVDEIHSYYSSMASQSQIHLVEARLIRLKEHIGTMVIVKAPQQPSGLTYVASLTIPFADFSYVFKVQCPERGSTGARETFLMMERLASGKLSSQNLEDMTSTDWNPDSEEYDSRFPEHPLSRARLIVKHVAQSLKFDTEIKNYPAFPLPHAL